MKRLIQALFVSLMLLTLTGCIYDPGMYRQGGYYGDGYGYSPVQVQIDYRARLGGYDRPARSCYHYDGSRDNYHRRCLRDDRGYGGRRYGR